MEMIMLHFWFPKVFLKFLGHFVVETFFLSFFFKLLSFRLMEIMNTFFLDFPTIKDKSPIHWLVVRIHSRKCDCINLKMKKINKIGSVSQGWHFSLLTVQDLLYVWELFLSNSKKENASFTEFLNWCLWSAVTQRSGSIMMVPEVFFSLKLEYALSTQAIWLKIIIIIIFFAAAHKL